MIKAYQLKMKKFWIHNLSALTQEKMQEKKRKPKFGAPGDQIQEGKKFKSEKTKRSSSLCTTQDVDRGLDKTGPKQRESSNSKLINSTIKQVCRKKEQTNKQEVNQIRLKNGLNQEKKWKEACDVSGIPEREI